MKKFHVCACCGGTGKVTRNHWSVYKFRGRLIMREVQLANIYRHVKTRRSLNSLLKYLKEII